MKYLRSNNEVKPAGGERSAYICGAREDSGNIGEATVNALAYRGWIVTGDDCAVGDGSRPPGGNLPNAEVARQHGYSETERGWYQRFEAPSMDDFRNADADALVVTLGATYKGHFVEIADWEVNRILKANLILPLECVRRYVQASEREAWSLRDDPEQTFKSIVLVGSYAHNHPFTNGTLYCAAKAGLDMAGRALGWELTDRGYRVFVVHPYHVQGTPMWGQVEADVMRSKGMTWEEADAYNRKDLKMPDLLTAPEVAEIIATLITTPALGWLSGTNIELYGGSR